MKKVGIIRCRQTEDMCIGKRDFVVAREGKGVFEPFGPVEIIGFLTCGGCPGKRAVTRAKLLVEKGAEMVAIASCISRGHPINYPCPHFAEIKKAIARALDGKVPLLDWTH